MQIESEVNINKILKSFFGVPDNVTIILLGENDKDFACNSQTHIITIPQPLDDMPADLPIKATMLREACLKIGQVLNKSLYDRFNDNQHVFKNMVTDITMYEMMQRQDVGLLGNIEKYIPFRDRVNELLYRRNNPFFDIKDSTFARVEEDNLYLIKGTPTFYIKCDMAILSVLSEIFAGKKCCTLRFKYTLAVDFVEFYKI